MPTLHKPSDKAYNNYSSGYGGREAPMPGASTNHQGIDYGWGDGWNIYAALDGTISSARYYRTGDGWGGRVVIDHGNGIQTTYSHLNENSNLGFGVGARVSRGQRFSVIGNPTTGSSTGPHLHFEMYIDGSRVNPYPYFTQNVPRITGGNTGGTANLAAGQRTSNGVTNRRSEPTSQSANLGNPLQPGEIGNFTGWIRGEAVEGNNVWYQGTSGNWFWSGGFHEGANGTGLKDLNTVALAGNQRRVLASGSVNGRKGPGRSHEVVQSLAAADIGDFKGFAKGEAVEGNNIWFVGAYAGNYFWSGGFDGGANTAGLSDITPQAPAVAGNQRKVLSTGSVNGRSAPNRGASIDQSLDAGTVGDFKGYVIGEEVEGNAFWLVGAYAGKYFWSGAFEGGANMAGLTKLEAPTTGTPTTPAPTQDAAKKVTPVYPAAKEAWDTPRGREAREKNPVSGKIEIIGFAVHHTANPADQVAYFKSGGQGSVPTWYIDTEGNVYEFTRPGLRPVTTAGNNNWTVSVEIQNSGGADKGWPITEKAEKALTKLMAWVGGFDGKKLDGIDVNYKINDRTTKGHKDWAGNQTECPGPYVSPRIAGYIAEANVILGTTPKPVPEPGEETVQIPKGKLEEFYNWLKGLLGK